MSDPHERDGRRSVHVLPGSNERFIERARSLGADAIVFDLEDAVAPRAREVARSRTAEALRDGTFAAPHLSVRISSWRTPEAGGDLDAVVRGGGSRIDAIVLPKAVAADVAGLDGRLGALETELGLPRGAIGIEVIVETALGLAHVHELLASSARIGAVVLGPLDLAASLGVVRDSPGGEHDQVLDAARITVLVAGRAASIAVFDGPFVRIADAPGLAESARHAAALGFDGMWSIHPSQVPVINEAFTPSEPAIERALAILEAYRTATDHDGTGAVLLDGEMIDEATCRLARVLVARGDRARRVRR